MLIIDILITLGPLLSYYSQYSLMLDNKSVGTFSIDICCIIIIANVLRIFFWFTTGFANNLLIQSFLILGMHFLILDLCIKLGYKSKQDEGEQRFWRWNSFKPFLIFTAILATIVAITTAIFINFQVQIYGTVLGLLSLSIEATLGFPQLISNQKNKSVDGLSIFMVVTWFVGDFLKTIYFVVENQPFQFILSGAIQLTVDTLIIIQIMAFKDSSKKYKNVKQDGQYYGENDHQTTVDESQIVYQLESVKKQQDLSEQVHGI